MQPDVECVMVLGPGLDGPALDAVDDFESQDYRSTGLTVLTASPPGGALGAALKALGGRALVVIDPRLEFPPRRERPGAVVAWWDPLCRHHPRRLTFQVGELLAHRVGAVALADGLAWDEQSRRAYVVDRRAGRTSQGGGAWCESLVFDLRAWPAGVACAATPAAAIDAVTRCPGASLRVLPGCDAGRCLIARRRVPREVSLSDPYFGDLVRHHALSGPALRDALPAAEIAIRRLGLFPPALDLADRSGIVIVRVQ